MTAAGPDFFAGMYAGDDDPWDFAGKWYEQRKRALTLAALPAQRYRSGFEPGCAVGLLTAALAERCDALLSSDIAPRAVELTTARVARLPHVRVERRTLPGEWPVGERFDLVVLSELGYYLAPPDWERVLAATLASLAPDGVVLLCHWRHPVPQHIVPAEHVHGAFLDSPALPTRLVHHVEEDFLLDVLAGPGHPSVARAGGLVG